MSVMRPHPGDKVRHVDKPEIQKMENQGCDFLYGIMKNSMLPFTAVR